MLSKILRILMVIMVISICCVSPVMAGTSTDVVIWATPSLSTGIIGFTVTYISETQLDLTWGFGAGVDNIMIRAKYGAYPDDIPDEDTAPTDGYLVYYGSGVSVSDTSMDFDTNLGTLYYKAWAQKVDGHWYVTTSTGSKESEVVILILLFGFGLAISGWAIARKDTVIAVIASAVWLATISYTRAYPIGNMTTGDTADTAILAALIGLMILVPVISFRLNKKEEATQLKDEGLLREENKSNRERLDEISSTRSKKESGDDYYNRLHGLTHPKR